MKKTVTINLSGIIFHIDEDAHDHLSSYLAKIRGYFTDSEGQDEIMSDIESRIAEMFQEKISKSKEVINMVDVEKIISIMGKPEDYLDDTAQAETQSETNSQSSTGGKTYTRTGTRRVFRDPDNEVLGGVCGGIGAYFNIDPIWLRLAFVFSLFVFGTGLLFYIILWIIIPEAKTTAEKLEMRGEPVNVSNIEKSIKEELDNLKKKFNDLADGTSKSRPAERAKGLLSNVVDFIISILTFAVKTIAKFIGVIFIGIGIVLIIMLLGSWFGTASILSITPAGVTTLAHSQMSNLFFTTEGQFTMSSIAILLVLGIPVIALIYNGIKMLLGIKKSVPGIGIAAMALWVAGAILGGYVASQVAMDFRKKGITKHTVTIPPSTNNTLYLEVIGDEYDDEDSDAHVHINDWFFHVDEENQTNYGECKLDVRRSHTDSFEIVTIYSARGKSRKVATNRSGQINYEYTRIDSLVQFDPYFHIENVDKWRNQRVTILVKVPLNGSVYLNHSMDRVIYDIDNTTDTYDGDMVGYKWTMLEEGLTCVDCPEEEEEDSRVKKRRKDRKKARKQTEKEAKEGLNPLEEKLEELEEGLDDLEKDLEELEDELDEEIDDFKT
ncbi:MAG: PspC domain-containing protein [Flavobacteriales bacterium]|nr:PspC domain-containing protein [Flavobacteriales bacterium]